MNKKLKTLLFVLFDCVCVSLSYIISVRLFEQEVFSIIMHDSVFILNEGSEVVISNLVCLIIGVAVSIGLNFLFRLYSCITSFAGFLEAFKVGCAMIAFMAYNCVISIFTTLNIPWAIISSLLAYGCVFLSRFYLRIKDAIKNYARSRNAMANKTRLMIIGAGSCGANLIREMKTSVKATMNPVCVLDDDDNKLNREINGVKVVGKIKDVKYFAEKFNVKEIIIAMPSVDPKKISEIVDKCKDLGCKIKTVPGLFQLVNGQVSVSDIKDVSIDDLLGREQVKVNMDEIMGFIEGQTVLVTGGGGSIGSELCRQIAKHNPRELIILDIYENNAYDIQQELKRNIPNLNLTVLIASVRDKFKIDRVFDQYRPTIVFHAAAHKHVPLMEDSPNEAVKNNVGGTLNVAECAGKYKSKRFILISTDKAVNPTNIMGATKRICEMIIQAMSQKYSTEYVAVRFGNVLGSNGSVIPLFKKQIKEGGPVTVTHKEVVRYFMTIPEAVSLVLQAGSYAKGGEIFVLDMGKPVKIYDLAVNMIKLSGFEPYKDIDIKITGLRPGEKMYEERLMEEEGLQKTENQKISIGKPLEIDEELFDKLEILLDKAYTETNLMKELVHEIVPTYKIDLHAE